MSIGSMLGLGALFVGIIVLIGQYERKHSKDDKKPGDGGSIGLAGGDGDGSDSGGAGGGGDGGGGVG